MNIPDTPRGLRINNPFNIKHSKSQWKGLAEVQPDKVFCAFVTPQFGLRAGMVVLLNYKRFYHLDTVAKIITRWAPDTENPTEAYITNVAKAMGVAEDAPVDVEDFATLLAMVKPIIRQEQAQQPFDDEMLTIALAMAGVKP